jgi:hypothetical protein
MKANGHSGFATTAEIGITIPHVADYALVGQIVGLLMASSGTALLIRVSRRRGYSSGVSTLKWPTTSTLTRVACDDPTTLPSRSACAVPSISSRGT